MLTQITAFISALANLLWPILAFIIFFTLKKHIVKLIPRVKKLKIAGQEIELDKAIDKFQESVKKSIQEIPEQPSINPQEENTILQSAANEPKMGIIAISIELEKTIKNLYATMGMLNEKNYVTPQQALEVMIQKGYIPKHTVASLEIFRKLRNEIVHGQDVNDDKEVIRVLDIGLTLLQTLKSIPHQTNVVYETDIDIYSDEKCTTLVPDAKGLLLEMISPGGVEKKYMIYPTTKIGYYIKGNKVSWEWDLKKTWLDTWYKDTKTKEIKQGWNSSGNFIGRHMEEL